jgi:hypothetical protein
MPVTSPVLRGFVIITKNVPGGLFSEISCTQAKRSVCRERGGGVNGRLNGGSKVGRKVVLTVVE